jgi:hypothetical protein
MQLRDDWRYAEDGDGIGFGSLANRQEALRKGSVLGDWMRGLPAIQQIADNLFVHAGMMDQRNYGRSINDINAEIAVFLQQDSPRTVYDDLIWYGGKGGGLKEGERTRAPERKIEVAMAKEGGGGSSPTSSSFGLSLFFTNATLFLFFLLILSLFHCAFRDRDLIEGAYNGRTCDRIPTILAPHAGAVRLFLGHTTVYSSRLGGSGQKDPLVMCNSTLHAIDVGISRWMNNNPRNYMLTINDFIPSTTSMELMVIPPLGPVRDCRRDYDYSDFRNGYSPQRYARCGVSGTCCRSYSGSNACYYTAEDQSMCDNLPPTCDYQPYEDGGFTGSNPQCTP